MYSITLRSRQVFSYESASHVKKCTGAYIFHVACPRHRKTIQNRYVRGAAKNRSTLIILGNDQQPLVVPLVWLRDHCRNPANFNEATNQRKSNAVDLLEKAKLEGMQSVGITDGTTLTIRWKDGLQSKFFIGDLLSSSQIDQRPDLTKYVKPWKKLNKDELPRMKM